MKNSCLSSTTFINRENSQLRLCLPWLVFKRSCLQSLSSWSSGHLRHLREYFAWQDYLMYISLLTTRKRLARSWLSLLKGMPQTPLCWLLTSRNWQVRKMWNGCGKHSASLYGTHWLRTRQMISSALEGSPRSYGSPSLLRCNRRALHLYAISLDIG